ncbi:MAG: hypothetical protein AAF242_01800, partial [Bacteroidota bacterium]
MRTSKIKIEITTNELSEATKIEMWNLYQNYYNYSRDYFMKRIHRNNYFSIYRVDGKIVGFTGLRINRTSVGDKQYLLIYVGQTIIDRAFRGNALIPRTAVKLLMKYWKDLVRGRIYFWADALTYKAYLVFAKTVHEFYPTYKKPTPKTVKTLLDFVGDEYYAEAYNVATGTIKKNTVFVNDQSTIIDQHLETDPDVLFFAQANPEYINGHGLLTITPMHSRNYLVMLRKCIIKLLTERRKKLKSYGQHSKP